MKNLLDNNRMVAFMTIAILAVGSISIMGTNHVVMADQIAKVCIIVACDSSTNLGSGFLTMTAIQTMAVIRLH